MSVWENIKKAIFGHADPSPTVAAAGSVKPGVSAPAAGAATTAAKNGEPAGVVDIESVMKGYESRSQQKLNWRTSIVDLLKLLGIDSSFANRSALAKELGYTGSTTDSASMNIWLHKQVIRKLQESGGKVPASLMD